MDLNKLMPVFEKFVSFLLNLLKNLGVLTDSTLIEQYLNDGKEVAGAVNDAVND